MVKGLFAGAVLLTVAACSSGTKPAVSTLTPTPPPPDGGTFTTPAAIVAKAGPALPCTDASPMTPQGAHAQSVCSSGGVVIRVYADHSGVDEQIDLLGVGGAWLLTGENWSINGPHATLRGAKARLGGKLIHVKCTSMC